MLIYLKKEADLGGLYSAAICFAMVIWVSDGALAWVETSGSFEV